MRIVLAIAAASAVAACASPMMMGSKPYSQAMLPAPVQVPAGHAVAMETTGSGEITYECRAKAGSADQFEWAFVGPKATLADRRGRMVGRYYGPPATWESSDASKITGTQVAVAPAGEGDIPLQLVKANPASGAGAMNGVSYIQRVATKGGAAPRTACTSSESGRQQTVTYSADYIFYRPV